MKREVLQIKGRECIFCGEPGAKTILVQLVGEFDEDQLTDELEQISALSADASFGFAGLRIRNSNEELSPWKAPAVFKTGDDFGDGAEETLQFLVGELLPAAATCFGAEEDTRYILGGYSLAGLFALWAGYVTDRFYGIAAASPSVWFPKWDTFIQSHPMQAKRVYLSLGDKEAKTRNPQMAQVAKRMELQTELLKRQLGDENCGFFLNPGNHFKDAGLRKAKAFAWFLQ